MTRRQLLGATLAAPVLARKRITRARLSAITDEIGVSPEDALAFAGQYGLQWIELRRIPGTQREYAFLPEAEVKTAAASFKSHDLKVSFLNSSLLKFEWPGMEAARHKNEKTDARRKRLAADKERFANRLSDLKKAIRAAQIFGVDQLRVFAGYRVVEPRTVFERVVEVIGEMAFIAEHEKVRLLVENEGSCNVGTSSELAALMKALPSKAVGINWDPHNDLHHNEPPFPEGYRLLPKQRLWNVQAKGKSLLEAKEKLDWKVIFQALGRDGYKGAVGLETHYFDGTLIEKSHASIKEMIRIAEA